MPLRFTDADESSITDLQQLNCVEPAVYDPALRRKVHRAEWALEAQSLLRNLRPPLDGTESLVLAYDDEGLAAACHYEFMMGDADTEPTFYIGSIGCSSRCQNQGVASELLTHVLDQIEESNFAHSTSWGTTTLIHEENQASKRLASRHGFSWRWHEGYGYELWGR